jgi:hypothetical protein
MSTEPDEYERNMRRFSVKNQNYFPKERTGSEREKFKDV